MNYENLQSQIARRSRKLVIAMDGPAGAGKSSLAKKIADALKIHQVDSGAIYRAYTYLTMRYCRERSLPEIAAIAGSSELLTFLSAQPLDIRFIHNKQVIFYEGRQLDEEIRNSQTTANIKYLASEMPIRNLVNEQIRGMAAAHHIVADGRDMGTAVFPDADLKFYITASLTERSKRRLAEFRQKQPEIELADVESQVAQRDSEDENREIAPLKKAGDAIIVDTTLLSLDSALELLLQHVQAYLANSPAE